jgi:hypothetical protein
MKIKKFGFLVLLLVVSMFFVRTIWATDIQVSWNANTDSDLWGYILSYGVNSGIYSNEINVGNVINYTITNVDITKTYYIALQAYDKSLNESQYSNQVFISMPVAMGFYKNGDISYTTTNGGLTATVTDTTTQTYFGVNNLPYITQTGYVYCLTFDAMYTKTGGTGNEKGAFPIVIQDSVTGEFISPDFNIVLGSTYKSYCFYFIPKKITSNPWRLHCATNLQVGKIEINNLKFEVISPTYPVVTDFYARRILAKTSTEQLRVELSWKSVTGALGYFVWASYYSNNFTPDINTKYSADISNINTSCVIPIYADSAGQVWGYYFYISAVLGYDTNGNQILSHPQTTGYLPGKCVNMYNIFKSAQVVNLDDYNYVRSMLNITLPVSLDAPIDSLHAADVNPNGLINSLDLSNVNTWRGKQVKYFTGSVQ